MRDKWSKLFLSNLIINYRYILFFFYLINFYLYLNFILNCLS